MKKARAAGDAHTHMYSPARCHAVWCEKKVNLLAPAGVLFRSYVLCTSFAEPCIVRSSLRLAGAAFWPSAFRRGEGAKT